METYKAIRRNYYEDWNCLTFKKGIFIAQGQWADGHLAYSRLDEDGKVIEDEQGAYVQLRGRNGLFMQRI